MTQPLSEPEIQDRLAAALGPKYEVRRLLGRGGFAEVYEVWDRELERRLAVKVLRPDIAWTPGMLQRFRQETKAVARLSHPNVLTIHFVGEGQDIVYYAMPFVEGESLADLLRREERLAPERVMALARAVLDALQHAHDMGLLHRDIKPENIMIERASGKPLLVDFGIAKRLDGGKGVTQTGFVVGTPQYMSPEQALGDTNLDARSDLYSMGAVLFQMLTGAPPFGGETSQEIVAKHITEPPPAPSSVNPAVPQGLSDVVVKCLAKKPAARYQSAAEVLQALDRAMGSVTPVAFSRAQARTSAPTVKLESGQRRAAPGAGQTAVAGAGPGGERGTTSEVRRRAQRTWLWWVAGLLVVAAVLTYVGITRPVLYFRNQLVEPVRIIAGARERLVGPGRTIRVVLSRRLSAVAEWRMLQPTSREGTAMGVELTGTLAFDQPRGRQVRAAAARDSGHAYFAPLITNNTGRPIEITVNAGLVGALDCHRTIPPGATRVRIGYYPLFANSTVQARDREGAMATFTSLGADVDPTSGVVRLRFGPTDLRPTRGR